MRRVSLARKDRKGVPACFLHECEKLWCIFSNTCASQSGYGVCRPAMYHNIVFSAEPLVVTLTAAERDRLHARFGAVQLDAGVRAVAYRGFQPGQHPQQTATHGRGRPKDTGRAFRGRHRGMSYAGTSFKKGRGVCVPVPCLPFFSFFF